MPDIADGDSVQVKGSGSSVYTLKNTGGLYSCTCPAWMHQGLPIEKRTCKHLRAHRGDAAETERLGSAGLLSGKPSRPRPPKADGESAAEPDGDGAPVLLAHKWENDVELTGWWISEKLDGVRAYWDGTRFLSRLGNAFVAPKWFTEKLPSHPLDGELWGGRKQFQRTVGIVKRQDGSDLWKELQYVVFDAPAHGGVFEERIGFVEQLVADLKLDWLRACAHQRCRDLAHLKQELARVEGLGGEGLMVRRPGSRYEVGRSSSLLKVKNFYDAEARVIGHVPGAGRHKGRLGALLVEMPDGTQFNVGTGFSDAERERPPALGTIITYRYQELSNAGVPRFPSYVGERIDGTFVPAQVPGRTVRRVDAVVGLANAPAPEPQPPAVSAGEIDMALRRFEMTDGDTRYFWEIDISGATQKIRYGTFDEKEKRFEDDGEARENTDKKIAEKLAKGFTEVTVAAAAAPAKKKNPFAEEEAEEQDVAAPARAPAKKAEPVAAPAAPPSASGKSSKSGTGRYFEFIEGSSAKFWEITIEGTRFFTRYGKIGTDGQMTQKDYDSEATCAAEAARLVAEKTRKGYVEK